MSKPFPSQHLEVTSMMGLGIDCGTCYSSAAFMQNGSFKPIKEPLTHGFSFPSSAFVTEGAVLVGQAAEVQRRRYPSRCQREFKRDLGRTVSYHLGDRQLLPEELISHMIRALKTEAEQMTNVSFSKSIITVPAHYRSYKQQLMQEAAKQAGFTEVEILAEPIAVAIYYAREAVGEQALNEGDILLVYDLGGGTFNAALVQKCGQGFELLVQPVGDENCGGIDFDRQIYADLKAHCSDALRQLLELQQSDEAALRTRLTVGNWCRDFKHQLSVVPEHTDLLALGTVEETYTLSRTRFEAAIAPLVARTCELCQQLVRAAGLSWEQVRRVLMVGGSCRIPYIRKVLEQQFCRPVVQVDELELAVCFGAALYAARSEPGASQSCGSSRSLITTAGKPSSKKKIHCPYGGFDAFLDN